MNDMELCNWFCKKYRGRMTQERNRAIDIRGGYTYAAPVASMRTVHAGFVYAILEPWGA